MTVQSGSEAGLKILLTDGSSISTREILYDLGPHHTIDILDSNPLCLSRFSRFVRRWYRCPSFGADPCGFLRCVGERLATEKYDVLLPMHDEIFLIARVRDALEQRVALAVHDFSVVDRLQSKLQFLKICQDLQLPHPESRVISSERELNGWHVFPSFVKLDYGTAGQTVKLVHDQGEMRAAIAKFRGLNLWSEGTPVLIQRPSTGTQSVFRGIYRQGELVSHHISVLVMRGVGGSAVVRESADHPVVVEHMRRFGKELGCHGPLFADYFYDEATQTPSYIEANPRVGDTANDFFSGQRAGQHWVDVALGNEPVVKPPSRANVRSHSAMLVVMSRALEGAGRRQLFQECLAQAAGSGIYENSEEELTRFRDDWLSAIPYLWVTGRLLARPAVAQRIVGNTVANYSLTAEAAERIRRIPIAELVSALH